MRIRRCASRLLGSAAAAPLISCSSAEPPRFELPAPAPPAPADESRPGLVAPDASSSGEPCCELSQSPWDLMDQLDLSDPQVEKLFEETHFVSVTWRSSWLFLPSMPAFGSIKEDQEQEDMSEGVELHIIAAKKMAREKNGSKLKKNKGVKLKKGVWTCRKNDGKGWFCRRLTREPNSYCSYHSDHKLKLPGSEKPHGKRAPVNVGEEFYYYAGFGPGTKRRRTPSSDSVPEPPLLAEPLKEEAPSEIET
ncbi:hypothetical protein CFC21_074694 [Triticum aestivum]|uniref:WRC domain-containing protein n=3 Tax=Triticum TaxID=4564 RepID=A0A3B6LX72_WHEAT|nr:uncharacterized protein LOC123117598 [Triticum aestivum]KAF7069006.1 hypothetical protein CFC21_074694 [Triticum aestivum]